jgi:release factor glutamine methyltransferase
MTVAELIAEAARELREAGVESPDWDAERLLRHVLRWDRAQLVASPAASVPPEAERRFRELARERARRVPLQHLVGSQAFWRHELVVTPAVLVPRPETELLVDLAENGQRVLDVGTGSGAIALAIAQERQGVRVTGIDNSPDAIDVARANAERNGLDVEFMIADLIVGGPYDLIVSNPPYVRESDWPGLAPEITLYEPQEALVAGPDGLDVIRDLVPAAADALVRGGLLAVEVGQGQSRAVEALFEKAGLRAVETDRDLAGIPRVVKGRR